MRLADKVVVITGAAGGIGAAMAHRFAAEGAGGLLLADRAEEGVRAVAADVTAAAGPGVTVLPMAVDVADEARVHAMVEAAQTRLGPIDLLCSNAGVGTGAGLDATADQWAGTWAINVLSHVYAARAAVPAMVRRGSGYLLNTCSAAGLLTSPGDAPYAVTKHAAVAFAEWLAVTYGDAGIKVSALCPQGVNTPLLTDGLDDGQEAARVVAAAGRVMEAAEVADAVVAGLRDERFLILPHPEVAEYERRKATDRDRWLGGLRRLVRGVRGAGDGDGDGNGNGNGARGTRDTRDPR
jgi:NAD(P)-dependent dehydrogenase (short-subunit alcohol dehydrogenase family)